MWEAHACLMAVWIPLQGFIRVADLQSLTYAAEKAASIAGGETVEQLEVRRLIQHGPLLGTGLDVMHGTL